MKQVNKSTENGNIFNQLSLINEDERTWSHETSEK